MSESYRAAGVDLEAADRAKDRLKELVASTRDANTLSELGAFGGLYAVPDDVEAPVLVSSADGVGTKLKVAFMTGRHDTVGQDLVNHCVNDILVQGARPIFFLDYLATGAMDESVVTDVVTGVALACRENGCALLGGETAQMPDFYEDDEYDLAGFIVGVTPRAGIVDGSRIEAGDALIGLRSSGLHTNGYTLARRIVFETMGLGVDDPFPGLDRTAGEVLLDVHRSYLNQTMPLIEAGQLRGLVHNTGGGLPGNLPRILPDGLGAVVERSSWEPGTLFDVLQREGGVGRDEMYRVFNMGAGMILVVGPDEVDGVMEHLRDAGESPWLIGEIEAVDGDDPRVRYAD
ncbi:MAG TPA: phosphoribosylformylglycinamidine cyclo-ligase [Longimicrobiales bacterium]|nr:phosphoribosylformylglycinamidine cyclo-ligase [Longimicrobiales bacterium]